MGTGDRTLRDRAGADDTHTQTSKVGLGDVGGLFHPEWFCDSVTFPPLGCKGVKAKGFLCSGSLHGGSSLSWDFLFSYCITIKLF